MILSLLSPDTTLSLRQFLSGEFSLSDFEQWITSAVDDDSLLDAERRALRGVRLVLIEFGEGLRPLDEVRGEAASLLIASAESNSLSWSSSSNILSPSGTTDVGLGEENFTSTVLSPA